MYRSSVCKFIQGILSLLDEGRDIGFEQVIEMKDYASRRRLRVTAQLVRRDANGCMAVKVEWVNEAPKPYRAQVRVSFLDGQGLPVHEISAVTGQGVKGLVYNVARLLRKTPRTLEENG